MNDRVPEPARGGDVLPWARAVTEVCRRFGGVGSGSLLVREGPGGVGYEAGPENRRSRRSAEDRSLFAVRQVAVVSGGETAIHAKLVNCYWKDGAVLRSLGDVDLDGGTPKYGLICLKVPTRLEDHEERAAEIVAFGPPEEPDEQADESGEDEQPEITPESMSDILSTIDWENPAYEIHPLWLRTYRLDDDGNVVSTFAIDFRNAPLAQKWELL